jgi:hypothetical protein
MSILFFQGDISRRHVNLRFSGVADVASCFLIGRPLVALYFLARDLLNKKTLCRCSYLYVRISCVSVLQD